MALGTPLPPLQSEEASTGSYPVLVNSEHLKGCAYV